MPSQPAATPARRKKLRLQHAKKMFLKKIEEFYQKKFPDLVFDKSILVFELALNREEKEERMYGKGTRRYYHCTLMLTTRCSPPPTLNPLLPEADQRKLYGLSIFETWDKKNHADKKTHEALKAKPQLERSRHYRQRWIRHLKIKQFVLEQTKTLQSMMPPPKRIKRNIFENDEAFPERWSVAEALRNALDTEATEKALKNVGISHPEDVKDVISDYAMEKNLVLPVRNLVKKT